VNLASDFSREVVPVVISDSRDLLETFICRVHNRSMAALDRWTEVLRCPFCTLTGVASLSLGTPDDRAIVVDHLPSGFKVVSSEHGDTFFCEACNRAAIATTK
jgi:hypothetical protein